MAKPFTVTIRLPDSEDRDVEIVADYTPGSPGRTYGPPEDCYPPESPDIQVVKAGAVDFGADVAEVLEDYDRICEAVEAEVGSIEEDQAAMEADYRADLARDDAWERKAARS